jgi:uncharacterized protein YggE
MPTTPKKFIFPSKILFALGLAVIVFYTVGSFSTMNWGSVKLDSDNYVTVTGKSSSKIKNQLASFNASVSSENEDRAAALESANTQMATIISEGKKFGIEDDDMKTQGVNVYQNQEAYYENGYQKFRPGNWVASLNIELKLRDGTKASEFATALTNLGISNLYGPNFTADDESVNESTLLADAILDARSKAEAVAVASGKKLGPVLRVVEGYAADNGGIVYAMMDKGMGGGGGGFTPGSTEFEKTVTVTYSLQ